MPYRSTGDPALDDRIARQVRYTQSRWAEIWLACLMVAVGVSLLMPGDTFTLNSFSVIRSFVGEDFSGWLAVTVGTIRLWALYMNGRRNMPAFRVVGCAGGFLFWTGWGAGFFFAPPPVVPLFFMSFVLAAAELHSSGRAARDAYAFDTLGLRKRGRGHGRSAGAR